MLDHKILGFKLVKKGSLFDRHLDRKGYQGYMTLFGTVYIKEGFKDNQMLLAHEQAHVVQFEKQGALRFNVMYLYYQLTVGYWDNPYEIEARQAAGDIRTSRGEY